MTRLAFIILLTILLCPISHAARPNVIIVMTDDQGYGELSVHGNPILKTPHLDQLHAESIRLTDYHVAPMCTPTRGQLLTGLDAARNGAINVSSGRTLLRADLPTMADLFKANGYRTGLFGKWHLGDNYPYRPQDRGFEETLWFPSSHINSVPDWWDNDYFDDTFMVNGERKQVKGYCTDVFFREAMSWMKARADAEERFLTYIPTNAPHGPFWAPDKELQEALTAMEGHELPNFSPARREQLAAYFGMILNIDHNVGKLMAFLEEHRLVEDTILIFQTDNGSTFGHQYFNAEMRGRKTELWEGGHRVPFFLRWPGGNLGKARDIAGLTQVQDVLPTLMELCDVMPSQAPRFDGISLAPVLRGNVGSPPEERMLIINYSRMPWYSKYPMPDAPSVMHREGAGVLWKRWRLLEDRELYNLATDPLQSTNVIEKHPEVVASMRAHLDHWWHDVRSLANEPQPVIIGSDHENPMLLTACEWLDVFVDQQSQIRRGVDKNGYWHLEVAEAGEYSFELRRWPRELDLALTEGLPETEVTAGILGAGKAFPIATARLQVNRLLKTKQVARDDKSVSFTYNLEKGPVRLYSWFCDERRIPICGAYYVYINRR